MKYRIVPHPAVTADMRSSYNLIANYAGPAIGRAKVIEIRRSMQRLRDYPHIGTLRNEIATGLRAIPAAEKAVICFKVDDASREVRIICVTYAGQDWQSLAEAREGQA